MRTISPPSMGNPCRLEPRFNTEAKLRACCELAPMKGLLAVLDELDVVDEDVDDVVVDVVALLVLFLSPSAGDTVKILMELGEFVEAVVVLVVLWVELLFEVLVVGRPFMEARAESALVVTLICACTKAGCCMMIGRALSCRGGDRRRSTIISLMACIACETKCKTSDTRHKSHCSCCKEGLSPSPYTGSLAIA